MTRTYYSIKMTGNLWSGHLATKEVEFEEPFIWEEDTSRKEWRRYIKRVYGGDFSKLIDFEVTKIERTTVVTPESPWELEDSDINYEMINDPEGEEE